jgi:hypothetical protein
LVRAGWLRPLPSKVVPEVDIQFAKSRLARARPAYRNKMTAASNKHVESVYFLQLKLCKDILNQISAHEFAFLFAQPVDVIGLGLDDYNTIIKSPMDFSTIAVE